MLDEDTIKNLLHNSNEFLSKLEETNSLDDMPHIVRLKYTIHTLEVILEVE